MEDYNKYLVATLERADAEKRLVIAKIDTLAVDQKSMNDLRSELHQRSEDYFRLQQDFNEHLLMLQEEREKNARLMNENAVLMAQAEDDRTKISALVRMRKNEMIVSDASAAAPMRVSVLRQPQTAKRGEAPSMSLRSVVTDYAAKNVCVGPSASQTVVDAAVQAPPSSALVTMLSKEIDSLKSLLDQQRRAYEHDRALRVSQERDRFQIQEKKIRDYADTIENLQKLQNEATRELVTYRHERQIAERNMRSDIEVLTTQLHDAKQAVVRENARQCADMQLALECADSRHSDLLTKLRHDLHERKEAAMLERDRLERIIENLQAELRTAKLNLVQERRSKKRVIDHHKFENEGMQTEVNLMKQHLRAVEKKVFFGQARQPSSI
jgi:hypothetical protein